MNTNILIIEDEGIVALDISTKLEKKLYNISGIVDNGMDAIEIVKNQTPDLILIDISIKGQLDGIQTAEAINKFADVPFIYITALSDTKTLERIKKTTPYAYLLKPFRDIDLHMAIELAFQNASNASNNRSLPSTTSLYQIKDRFFIKTANGKFEKIMLDTVLYLEADRSYSIIHTSNKKYILSESLNNLLEQISYEHLIRIHKSYAVNLLKIDAFHDNRVCISELKIPIGGVYSNAFISKFNMLK